MKTKRQRSAHLYHERRLLGVVYEEKKAVRKHADKAQYHFNRWFETTDPEELAEEWRLFREHAEKARRHNINVRKSESNVKSQVGNQMKMEE